MHSTDTIDGGLDAEQVFEPIEQSPGVLVFASAADTELALAAEQWPGWAGDGVRLAHAAPLRNPVCADDYLHRVLSRSRFVCLRLLGGAEYFPRLVQALQELKDSPGAPGLLVLAGGPDFDPALLPLCTVAEADARRIFEYFSAGGAENIAAAGRVLWAWAHGREPQWSALAEVQACGLYRGPTPGSAAGPVAWHIFYRAWYQAGDLAAADALHGALAAEGMAAYSYFVPSLQQAEARDYLAAQAEVARPDIIITSTSFAADPAASALFGMLGTDCAVLQAPVSSLETGVWRGSKTGLPPTEIAMNYALPELDGRIAAGPIAFKEAGREADAHFQFAVKRLVPEPDQIAAVARLARRHAALRSKPNREKKIAVILSNYPDKDSRLANGVGLDAPESCARLLAEMRARGYGVEAAPENGAALMGALLAGMTNETENSYGKEPCAWYGGAEFERFFKKIPEPNRAEIEREWQGHFAGRYPVCGILCGNVFVGIQPPRGYGQQTQAIYHSPALPPPPGYLAFYAWIREVFGADAVVHLGKHGNLEWLPGRAAGLGQTDYPAICLGDLPLVYPFIVNNPGEGIQAKRRAGAVIVDHLTPPLVRAGLYGDLEKMESLVEEHARCASLYPQRAPEIRAEIERLLASVSWAGEVPADASPVAALDRFLCGIKESQIRGGLHILGQAPEGELLAAMLCSLLRVPSGAREGLYQILAGGSYEPEKMSVADRDAVEARAQTWAGRVIAGESGGEPGLVAHEAFAKEVLLPRLAACPREIGNLLAALDGGFVPPGPSGAPSRGRPDVLPTGRNFHGLDPRSAPTPTAWRCGKQLAERMLETHRQTHGEYPASVALILWGTSNMRTGGDDVAQALWLWGCEPVWDEGSGRVRDFQIVPLPLLGRPRVDVVLRVSGLFRDAFGDTARLLAAAAKKVASLDEPPEKNFVRASWLRQREAWMAKGSDEREASERAGLRVFTSPPGAYGCGILPLMDAGNWRDRADIAQVFRAWSSHALDSAGGGADRPEVFQELLGRVEAVHQNQDNREHDILDSDDYFQFQGGLAAAVHAARGADPAIYHGDSSDPGSVRVRSLPEELARVIRSRVLNPRWIEAMRRHGYKGAFEMAATVDYLYGYAATTGLVSPGQFEDVAEKLVLDPALREFYLKNNPAALRDAARKLADAAERNLWPSAPEEILDRLESAMIEAQGELE